MKDITFVDEKDNVIGAGTKQEAWSKGIAHRIARIFIFNKKGEMLIQKRADHIASAPGKWDQSAAGHVDEGEDYMEAAVRETKEETGIGGIKLQELTKYFSDEKDEKDKIKKRFNMLYKAEYDGEVNFDEDEVSEIQWINTNELEKWMKDNPDDFTGGFLQAYEIYQKL